MTKEEAGGAEVMLSIKPLPGFLKDQVQGTVERYPLRLRRWHLPATEELGTNEQRHLVQLMLAPPPT